VTNLRDILWLLTWRKPEFTWTAMKNAASMAEYISVRRDCNVSPLAAFHAIMEVGPYLWSDHFPGAPWRLVSAELCDLGYRQ
jgi:hypothetical protein